MLFRRSVTVWVVYLSRWCRERYVAILNTYTS